MRQRWKEKNNPPNNWKEKLFHYICDMKKSKTVDKIKAHLDQNGLKYKWLCAQVDISTGHLSNIFSGAKSLTPEMNDKINKALGTNFKLQQ